LHRAPRRLDGDRGAAATANEGSTDRRADRHTTAADIGFDRPDKLVLGNLTAVAVPQAHAAADPSCTVRCRPNDARRRHLRFEELRVADGVTSTSASSLVAGDALILNSSLSWSLT
jgi:hypothetical protein